MDEQCQLRSEIARLRHKLRCIGMYINDDAYAATFQTLGQYRTALMKELSK